jgi:hypothetical protein
MHVGWAPIAHHACLYHLHPHTRTYLHYHYSQFLALIRLSRHVKDPSIYLDVNTAADFKMDVELVGFTRQTATATASRVQGVEEARE